MHDETTPTTTERDTGNPPEWYWILAFPAGIVLRYFFRPDDLSTVASIAWWVGSLICSLILLWIVWEIAKRLRRS